MRNIYRKEYSSLYRGIVEDNNDPEGLGRCKIRVPSIHGQLNYPVSMLPWARPVVLSPVKEGRGSVNLPDNGDIVWVLFEGSNKEFPIYLGGTYATGEIAIDPDIVDFYIEDNSNISYHRKEKKYKISIGDNQVEVSAEGVKIIGNTEIDGDISVKGSVNISGNLSVGGTTTLSNLIITGSCNKECDCP